jgi:LacI family transcriptional regulator
MQKPKRLNQLAIAKATGVSRATVSLVLRGGQGSSKETKAKVIAAAEKMGYRPNALVQGIRSGKSRSVGVLVPPHDTYWKDVCYGIHDRLVEANHLPLFLWDSEHHSEPSGDYALKQIHRLLDRWVDGVILSPEFSQHYATHLQEFERRNIPLVVIDHTIPELPADNVESDEAQIASLAVSHLVSQGHRSYLILTGPKQLGWADERCDQFVRELERHPGCKSHTVRLPLQTYATETVIEILRKDPSITAVLAATDIFAHQAYLAASALSWNIPARLSVIGVGNLNFDHVLSPPLTSIDQDGYQVGQKAAQVELERSSGILNGPARRFTIPVQLIERGSTGPATGNV